MSGMSEIGRRPEGLTGPESNIVKMQWSRAPNE